MASNLLSRHRLGADTLPVVLDRQAELSRLVVNRDDDARCLRVLDGVPQRLAGDPKRFVSYERIQIARRAIDVDGDLGGPTTVGSLVSSAPIAAMPFARSLTVVADARSPCTALRPSVMAASAWSSARCSRSRASSGREAIILSTD